MARGKVKAVNYGSVVVDPSVNPRAHIEEYHVEDLMESYRKNQRVEPPTVFDVKGQLLLARGFHRWEALGRLGVKRVRVRVVQGTEAQWRLDALTANQEHLGLKRSNLDKRVAVQRMMEFFPKMSRRQIAEKAGVSHTFVNEAFKAKGRRDDGEADEEQLILPPPADGGSVSTPAENGPVNRIKGKLPEAGPQGEMAPLGPSEAVEALRSLVGTLKGVRLAVSNVLRGPCGDAARVYLAKHGQPWLKCDQDEVIGASAGSFNGVTVHLPVYQSDAFARVMADVVGLSRYLDKPDVRESLTKGRKK
jgi:hypothetical protein